MNWEKNWIAYVVYLHDDAAGSVAAGCPTSSAGPLAAFCNDAEAEQFLVRYRDASGAKLSLGQLVLQIATPHYYNREGDSLGEDSPEAAQAWVEGRRFRAERGPTPDIPDEAKGPLGGGAPEAKFLDLYPEHQTLRIEWQIGWEYEHAREAEHPDEVHEEREYYRGRPSSAHARIVKLIDESFGANEPGEFAPVNEAIENEERSHPGSLMAIAADESQGVDIRGVAARMAVEMLGESSCAMVRIGAREGAEELDGLEFEAEDRE